MARQTLTRYRVVGIHAVLGYQPGTQFTASLDPVQETQLIAGGAIQVTQTIPAGPDPERVPDRSRLDIYGKK